MASNTLGTLTLDLVAKIGGFVEPIDRAERIARKAFDGIGASVNKMGEYSDKATKELAKLAQQMDSQFHDIGANMQREIALYGEVTRSAKLRYDLEKGYLKSMNAEQKASLISMASRLDAMDAANDAFRAQAMAANQLGGSFRNMRGMAQQFGWQMQDVAVQLQMGTSAFVVFSQQGSQLAAAFGPKGAIVGAIIAVAGALAGVLFKSLMNTNKAMEDMGKTAQELAGDIGMLTKAQQDSVNAAMAYAIEDQTKLYMEQTEAIRDQMAEMDKLRQEQGSASMTSSLEVSWENTKTAVSGSIEAIGGLLGWLKEQHVKTFEVWTMQDAIDNTDKLAEKQRELIALEVQRAGTLKAMREQTASGFGKDLNELNQQLELIGKTGEEYWKLVAAQKGYIEGNAMEFVAINMLIEALTKQNEEREKAKKDEESRQKSIEKLLQNMKREADLYGVTAREAKMVYDIENKLIETKEGLLGVEGKQLIAGAQRLDQLDKLKQEEDEWFEAYETQADAIEDVIEKLKEEERQLLMTAKARTAADLAGNGASPEQIDDAMATIDRIEAAKKEQKEMEDMAKRTAEMWNRIDESAAKAWENIFTGAENTFDGIKSLFTKLLSEMAHDAISKPIIMGIKDEITPWVDSFKKYLSQKFGQDQAQNAGSSGGGGMMGMGSAGVWGLALVGVAAAVSSFNKKQDEMVRKMTAEYRQSTQSLGTVLGESSKKSTSIADSLNHMADYADDTLSVNYQMYQALLDIREGITGVAAGFARQFGIKGVGDFSGVNEGTVAGAERLGEMDWFKDITDSLQKYLGDSITKFAGDFVGGLADKINKEVYKKKTKIIDSGIEIVGQTLADILADGTVDAFAYATLNVKKKVLGITTSNKTKTETDALDDILLSQFSAVFESAGDTLEKLAPVFGKEFSEILPKLIIDPMKLSLKGLEGDALVQEIEAFFSSTLDGWAEVLVGGSDVLEKFQKVGEGAFEAIIRLASETIYFTEYAERLGIEFNMFGAAAVEAAQNIAQAAGGIDALSKSLNTYYKEFFSSQEQAEAHFTSLSKRMKELGIEVVPQTRDAFRQLVEAQNLNTEAGQKQFAALIGLSGAVDQYVDALEDEVKVREEAEQKLREAVGSAFEAYSAAIQRDMDVVEEALSSSRDLANSLSSALRGMRMEGSRNDLMTRRGAQSQVFTSLAIAQAGGPLPTASSIEDALAVLSEPSQNLFSSFEDYARDFYSTKKNLEELEGYANTQVSMDEQTLNALQESLDYYQQQVDLLNGIDKTMLSVEDALSRLIGAFAGAGVVVPMSAPGSEIPKVSADRVSAVKVQENANSQSLPDIVAMLQKFTEDMQDSQYSIAKSAMQTHKLIERWDQDGMPQEREA